MRDDNVNPKTHEVRSVTSQLFLAAIRPASVDENVLAFDVAQLREPVTQGGESIPLSGRARPIPKPCDPPDPPRLLRLGSERCRKEGDGRGTEECSTLHYSIT